MQLVRHEVPDDFADVIYQACTVKLHPTLSLPSFALPSLPTLPGLVCPLD